MQATTDELLGSLASASLYAAATDDTCAFFGVDRPHSLHSEGFDECAVPPSSVFSGIPTDSGGVHRQRYSNDCESLNVT